MKKLIVTLKSTDTVLSDFKDALKKPKKLRKLASPHYEISFDNKKDFNRFISNIEILTLIKQYKPKSVYELAKIYDKDVSNLNKVISFFDQIGVIKIKKQRISGREVNTPIVEYGSIQFILAA